MITRKHSLSFTDAWLLSGAYPEICFGGYKNFGGGIKLQHSCSIAVLMSFLPIKSLLGLIFGGIYTHISPHHYTMAVIQPLSGTLAHFTSNTAVAAYMLVTMEVRH